MLHSELCSQLENIKNNLILGLSGVFLLTEERSRGLLAGHHAKVGGLTIDFTEVSKLLAEPADREIAVKECIKSIFRNSLKETFETIKVYCVDSNQTEIFQKFGSYKVAKHLRNAVSHDNKWDLRDPRQKELYPGLPFKWSGLVISADLDGLPVELSHVTFEIQLALVLDLITHAQQELK